MYDVTREDSYDNTLNWLRQVDTHCKTGTEKILVANKVDMEARVITKEQGEQMAQEYNLKYIETSAKTGQGCAEAFEDIA